MTIRRGGNTAEKLFRGHIAEMRIYASEIESVKVIRRSQIATRIRKCADECETALDRLMQKRAVR
jgi:ATP-dependent protease ClpP protease subunit